MENVICRKCNVSKTPDEIYQERLCLACRKLLMQEYYKKNKDKILPHQKEYYENNKSKIKVRVEEYRKRPEVIEMERTRGKIYSKSNRKKQYSKEYNKRTDVKERRKLSTKKNYSKRKEYIKSYRIKNKEKIQQTARAYNEKNKETLKEQRRNYVRLQRLNNPLFRLRLNINSLIRKSLQKNSFKKTTKTQNILGCTIQQFKEHLESKFHPWMNWDNYGKCNKLPDYGWDIDHIIPISLAKTEEDIIKLNHYTNLQPLCSYVNRYIKKDNTNFRIYQFPLS